MLEVDLSKMNKSDLMAYGSELGLELKDSMTVEEIIDKINGVV